jgi:hypothetical protein
VASSVSNKTFAIRAFASRRAGAKCPGSPISIATGRAIRHLSAAPARVLGLHFGLLPGLGVGLRVLTVHHDVGTGDFPNPHPAFRKWAECDGVATG